MKHRFHLCQCNWQKRKWKKQKKNKHRKKPQYISFKIGAPLAVVHADQLTYIFFSSNHKLRNFHVHWIKCEPTTVPKMSASNPEWSKMKANYKIQVTAKDWMAKSFSWFGRGELSLSKREMALRAQNSIDSQKKKGQRFKELVSVIIYSHI